jgi:hypothetical protein
MRPSGPTEATEEELKELILERLRIPDGIESVQDPEKRAYYEYMIEHLLSLPRYSLVCLLAPEEALY